MPRRLCNQIFRIILRVLFANAIFFFFWFFTHSDELNCNELFPYSVLNMPKKKMNFKQISALRRCYVQSDSYVFFFSSIYHVHIYSHHSIHDQWKCLISYCNSLTFNTFEYIEINKHKMMEIKTENTQIDNGEKKNRNSTSNRNGSKIK